MLVRTKRFFVSSNRMDAHQITPKHLIIKSFMKKYLLWLPVILLISSSAIINVNKNVILQAKSRNISFTVYKSIDYTSSVYDNSYVQLQISVEKVNETNRTLVWDKNFKARLLRDYPALDTPSTQILTVLNIPDGEGHLEVTYTRIYNSDGYDLQLKNCVLISQNSDNKLEISI
jgi:hypothetical protein